ncbi:MAG TPA: DUF3795 domain-containing protein [Vicinamibacterales bacterium]|jgi:hypothetical protein
MDRTDVFHLTAPCGIDCFNCEILEGNLTDERRDRLAARYHLAPAAIACRGCREQACTVATDCATRACVLERGLSFCSQCDDFPCTRLQPARAGADVYPHNIKLYNLCRIQAIGLQRWADEEATIVRRRYYEGAFKVGQGPVLASDDSGTPDRSRD